MQGTMLKILKSIRNSFLILILFIANAYSKDIRLPKDVGSGNTYSKSLASGFKKHGYTIVKKKTAILSELEKNLLDLRLDSEIAVRTKLLELGMIAKAWGKGMN